MDQWKHIRGKDKQPFQFTYLLFYLTSSGLQGCLWGRFWKRAIGPLFGTAPAVSSGGVPFSSLA